MVIRWREKNDLLAISFLVAFEEDSHETVRCKRITFYLLRVLLLGCGHRTTALRQERPFPERRFDPGCVKTCTNRAVAELFSPFSVSTMAAFQRWLLAQFFSYSA
jgi:hypothetical protein